MVVSREVGKSESREVGKSESPKVGSPEVGKSGSWEVGGWEVGGWWWMGQVSVGNRAPRALASWPCFLIMI